MSIRAVLLHSGIPDEEQLTILTAYASLRSHLSCDFATFLSHSQQRVRQDTAALVAATSQLTAAARRDVLAAYLDSVETGVDWTLAEFLAAVMPAASPAVVPPVQPAGAGCSSPVQSAWTAQEEECPFQEAPAAPAVAGELVEQPEWAAVGGSVWLTLPDGTQPQAVILSCARQHADVVTGEAVTYRNVPWGDLQPCDLPAVEPCRRYTVTLPGAVGARMQELLASPAEVPEHGGALGELANLAISGRDVRLIVDLVGGELPGDARAIEVRVEKSGEVVSAERHAALPATIEVQLDGILHQVQFVVMEVAAKKPRRSSKSGKAS